MNSPNQNLYQDAFSHSDRCHITRVLHELLLTSSCSPALATSLQKFCPIHITRSYHIIIFLDFSYLFYGIRYLFKLLLSNLAVYYTDTLVTYYTSMWKWFCFCVRKPNHISYVLNLIIFRYNDFLFSVHHRLLAWPNPSPNLVWQFFGQLTNKKISFLINISYIHCYFTVSS